MFITRCSQRVARANGLADHIQSEASPIENRQGDHSKDFPSALFHSFNNKSETEGDIANYRYGDGLSCPAYSVQMVKNKNDATSQFHPNIVHCGRKGTSRHKLFYSRTSNLVGMDGKPAGSKNNHALKDFNSHFNHIFRVFEPIFAINPHLKIPIFTEFRKNDILYRADPCSPHAMEDTEKYMTKSWCEWAMLEYNLPRNKTCLYPGHISGFTCFDTADAVSAFNQFCDPSDKVNTVNGGGYAIAQLTPREHLGFQIQLHPQLPSNKCRPIHHSSYGKKKKW